MDKLSAKQKHIYVTQGLQRQGSFRKDFQFAGAIDLALNQAQNRLIKDRLVANGEVPYKFQINSKHVSDIQELVKIDRPLLVFKESATSLESYGMLPYDFSYLLGDTSLVTEDCEETFKNPTNNVLETLIPFTFNSNALVGPYYRKIEITVGTQSATYLCDGFTTKLEFVYMIDIVIQLFNSLGVVAYWEQYKYYYTYNKLVLVTQNPSLVATLKIDDVAINADTTINNPVVVFKNSIAGYTSVNRDVKTDYLYTSRTSNFHTTSPDSPLSVLVASGIINVFGTKRFLVSQININYIKKPRKISLTLNQGSELSGTVHEEICDIAIQILKKQVADETYPLEVEDNRRIK